MTQPPFRVYWPDDDDDETPGSGSTWSTVDTVTVPLSEILPTLVDAIRSRRSWLLDFDEEEVTISADLYEVLLAYEHYHRPSA